MEIPYRIQKIETNEFASFPENYSGEGKFKLQIGFQFGAAYTQPVIRCKSLFTGMNDGTIPIFKLVVSCYFTIEPNAYHELFKENTITIPADFLRYMAMISTGTARGILHTKLENGKMSDYVLPPVNLLNIIKKDYVADLSPKK
ncbi:MAG: hypothetical protein LKH27_08465 [Prevotella sp.]|jgi:hypothetical protein|nr:hypothetical protein [Prevotella sp.]MCH3993381.1 hypothetical protein [Prevotella sp.]MCI1474431.1 hypothetical protein [Prevotella sp.]MCI1549079.1 hypothetical protein [Prevotella sp.]MCI1596017.1 hypothetical protein [Prevotella sp.]MCI2088587.1 hypothetical protein [Prevotella sp.]